MFKIYIIQYNSVEILCYIKWLRYDVDEITEHLQFVKDEPTRLFVFDSRDCYGSVRSTCTKIKRRQMYKIGNRIAVDNIENQRFLKIHKNIRKNTFSRKCKCQTISKPKQMYKMNIIVK